MAPRADVAINSMAPTFGMSFTIVPLWFASGCMTAGPPPAPPRAEANGRLLCDGARYAEPPTDRLFLRGRRGLWWDAHRLDTGEWKAMQRRIAAPGRDAKIGR